MFFAWAQEKYPRVYAAYTSQWRKTLVVQVAPSAHGQDHELFQLEEVRHVLAAVAPTTAGFFRDRAAMAFLFLSGMRVTAFTTLPILAVNIGRREVRQWPALGVKTKLSKAATTRT
jgi:site-specific recombinase XerD